MQELDTRLRVPHAAQRPRVGPRGVRPRFDRGPPRAGLGTRAETVISHPGESPMSETPHHRTLDANEAVADVAYRLSEVVAIYPITPASVMGEHADAWAADRRPNLWGSVPEAVQMQSEGG